LPDKPEPTFLDTAYVYASVNTRDEWHTEALRWQEKLAQERRKIVTTELVLVEIADGLASIRFRTQAVQIIAALQSSPYVEIIAMSSELLANAFSVSTANRQGVGNDRLCFLRGDARPGFAGSAYSG
jgi:predicted nucleic acid-binding protein